jgi:hypothetical protein
MAITVSQHDLYMIVGSPFLIVTLIYGALTIFGIKRFKFIRNLVSKRIQIS